MIGALSHRVKALNGKVKVNDLSERVVMVEQSTKSAHHRLDRYEEEEEIYHGKPRKRWWV